MVPDVSTGSDTGGLLRYLYGPGRRDEHTDPHIVAAWDRAGACDPGRDERATLARLTARLDIHVRLRARETGKAPARHVWHCPVRTAPGDPQLSDEEWAQVARRVVAAAGIAPEGDDTACRWIAVRHADDHIHIVATTVRADGRRARVHRSGQRAQAECRRIEAEFGLRRLKQGDGTAAPTPTSAERSKATRRGQAGTAREWLRERVRHAAAHAGSEAEFFRILDGMGVEIRTCVGPQTGQVIGYAVAQPGDTNTTGQPVFYGGSKLAPELSLNRIRERLTATSPGASVTGTTTGTSTGQPWRRADTALRETAHVLTGPDDPAAQAHLAACADLLHVVTLRAPSSAQPALRTAATAFARAGRSTVRADHRAVRVLRAAVTALAHSTGGNEDGAALAALLTTLVAVTAAAARWHERHGHQQQAAAAHTALAHLNHAQRAIGHAAPATTRREQAAVARTQRSIRLGDGGATRPSIVPPADAGDPRSRRR
jgi:hypothetical protein